MIAGLAPPVERPLAVDAVQLLSRQYRDNDIGKVPLCTYNRTRIVLPTDVWLAVSWTPTTLTPGWFLSAADVDAAFEDGVLDIAALTDINRAGAGEQGQETSHEEAEFEKFHVGLLSIEVDQDFW